LKEGLITREVRHMGKKNLEVAGKPRIGNAWLGPIGQPLRSSDMAAFHVT